MPSVTSTSDSKLIKNKFAHCFRALGLSNILPLGKQVYAAIHPDYGKVVIKFALSHLAKQQLINESQFLSNHHSIWWPKRLDSGMHHGIQWLIMELIEGKPLNKNNVLSIPSISLWQQLESGLQACHSHGYVHSDIKPSNILISNKGEITFIDFGSILPLQTRFSECATTACSPHYSSANLTLRQGKISQQLDYFSLAVTMQTLLSQHPFGEQPVLQFINEQGALVTDALPSRYHMIIYSQLKWARQLSALKYTG